jgi:curved DNA-binding protein CbpA
MHLTVALLLFRRLGVDTPSLSAREFTQAYFCRAKRYHPDCGSSRSAELMANINAARSLIIKAHAYRSDARQSAA